MDPTTQGVVATEIDAGLLDGRSQQLGQDRVLHAFAAVLAFGLLDELGQRLIGRHLGGTHRDEKALAVDGLAVGGTGELLELTGNRTFPLAERELREHGDLRGQDAVYRPHQRRRIAGQTVGCRGFDEGFGFGNRPQELLREEHGMFGGRRSVRHAVGAGNQQSQEVIVDEGVLMLEFQVGRRFAIGLHVDGYDDERAGDFAAAAFDGHLAGDQAVPDIDALVLLGLDALPSLGQPGLSGQAGIGARGRAMQGRHAGDGRSNQAGFEPAAKGDLAGHVPQVTKVIADAHAPWLRAWSIRSRPHGGRRSLRSAGRSPSNWLRPPHAEPSRGYRGPPAPWFRPP